MKPLLNFTLLIFCLNVYAEESIPLKSDDSTLIKTYQELVDSDGNISLPKNFLTEWVFLGAWSIASQDAVEGSGPAGAEGLHNVYTQRGVVEYYKEHKAFPDGAVFVKELLKGVTKPMTTGTVSRAGEVEGWFIMIKDTQRRFKDNPLWGNGWGWAFFKVGQLQTDTKNYQAECIGCHVPTQQNDWIYVEGYPLLQSKVEGE